MLFETKKLVFSEFDRYQISLGLRRPKAPLRVNRDQPRAAEFSSGLDPGKTYTVVVKTVSGMYSSHFRILDPVFGNFSPFR